MRHCLVTGYSGFIGSRITAALLERGVSVRGLTRQSSGRPTTPGLDLLQADLTSADSLQGCASSIDTVIHAAGHAHAYGGNEDLHHQVTVAGTRHLLAEAVKSGVQRLVFISSIKAMAAPGNTCVDESDTGAPVDAYGLARKQAEELVLACGQQTGMHVSILRPTLVYGPGCKGNLASLLRWIDKGRLPNLPDTGNRRSMVDVRDVVEATLRAATRAEANGRICILADTEDYSTRRIVTAMREALGKPEPALSMPAWLMATLARCGDGYETLFRQPALYNSGMHTRLLGSACYRSITVDSALGFHPCYRLEDALPDMVNAYRHSNRSPG